MNCASVEQLKACGLKTVKDQMKLRKLFHSLSSLTSSNVSNCTSTPSSFDSVSTCTPKSRKLTLKEMKTLSSEERRMYLSKLVLTDHAPFKPEMILKAML